MSEWQPDDPGPEFPTREDFKRWFKESAKEVMRDTLGHVSWWLVRTLIVIALGAIVSYLFGVWKHP